MSDHLIAAASEGLAGVAATGENRHCLHRHVSATSVPSMNASVECATEQDAPAIFALRHELEEWLESKGVEQWGRGEVGLHDVERQAAAGEWYVSRSNAGDLLAALRLLWSDELMWREQNAYAAYVHGLMVTRAEAGHALGGALLTWAEQQARAASAPALRLDCVESNMVLRAYYNALGFNEVGRRDFGGLWDSVVLLEKALDDT